MKSLWGVLVLSLSLGLCPNEAWSQLKPDFFPEDIETWDEQGRCTFCQPGVRNKSRSRGLAIVYGLQTQSTLQEEGLRQSATAPELNRLGLAMVNLKVPLIIKENFKFLASYKYLQENYAFAEFGSVYQEALQLLGDAQLKSNSIGLIVSKSLNEDSYLAFQAQLTTNGNYQGWMSLNKDYLIYKFRSIIGFKPTQDFEWGLGLNLSQSFRRFTFIPFVILNRNFNRTWGLESVLPAYIFLRYNLNDRNIFLFGPQYVSRSYRLQESFPSNGPDLLDYAFNHSEILASIRWEHQWIPWLWSGVRLGYQFNFSSDFESKTPGILDFQVDPANTPHLQISLFLSPPR